MPRRARIVVPDCAHHVTQRGNRGANVFRDDEDRFRYNEILREKTISQGVLIWTYTWMTNHIHAIVVPESEAGLAKTFRDVHSTYGRWFNRKYGLAGHLWQGRFYSCVLDESHLWSAVRYVERNPVRAGIVQRAEDYRWSSAAAHVHRSPDPLLDPGLPLLEAIGTWAEWLAATDLPSELEAIRNATARDFPLGKEEFVGGLEAKLGRRLRPQKKGRKSKGHEGKGQQQDLLLVD
jgi:putative transposase